MLPCPEPVEPQLGSSLALALSAPVGIALAPSHCLLGMAVPATLPCPSQASFFVVYNMVTTEVIAVFENTSDELLQLFENFCDLFRNATLHSEVQFPCSASSNNFARQIQRR